MAFLWCQDMGVFRESKFSVHYQYLYCIAVFTASLLLDWVMAGSTTLLAFIAIGTFSKGLLFLMKTFDKQL